MISFVAIGIAVGAVLLASIHNVSAWDDYDMIIIEAMNETSDLMKFGIEYTRIKKGEYGLSGTVEFLEQLTGIESELLISHKAKGSSQFVLTPYKLPRTSICTSLNNDYRKYLMNDLHSVSNLPYSEDEFEDICPQFSNTKFKVIDFVMTEETIPPSMEIGTYLVEGFIYRGNSLETGIRFIIDLF